MTDLQQHINAYFGISNDNLEIVTALFEESALEKGDFFTKKRGIIVKS